jgi:hypothetical protein
VAKKTKQELELAAPEGTHAKRRKRASRLKRAYRRAGAQQAVDVWHGVVAEIEGAMQLTQEALDAIANELQSVQGMLQQVVEEGGAGRVVGAAPLVPVQLQMRVRRTDIVCSHAGIRQHHA